MNEQIINEKNSNKGMIATVCVTAILLIIVQLKVETPMLLAERFISGGGWVEIVILSLYSGFLFIKMNSPRNAPDWRRLSWLLFSVVFFAQLILGLFGFDEFLMTGKLDFPIPGIILGGAIYRMEISFMPILFLSSIILSGPAWCSHLCYFGSFDSIAASGGRGNRKPVKNKSLIKHTILLLVIVTAIVLRVFNLPLLYVVISASSLGIVGVIVMLIFSVRQKKMIHCISYCPIGIVVSYMKFLSPFRIIIDNNCTECMQCTAYCKYDALTEKDIQRQRPGLSCTYCGDCITSCKYDAIKYKFLWLSPSTARTLYLVITISLHAIFLGLARI